MKRNDYAYQIMTLSLFLVVLVFFIALNNASKFKEDRVLPVLASLESAFASKIFGQKKNFSEQQSRNTPNLFSTDEFDQLSVALKNALSATNVIQKDGGDTLIMTFQKRIFLQSLTKKQSMGFMNFEEKLLDFLNNPNTPYMIDIQLYVENMNSFDVSQDIELLEQKFKQIKVTPDQFKISVKAGNPNLLAMTVRPKNQDLMQQIINAE